MQKNDGPLGQAATKSSLCYQGGSTGKRRTRYKYFLQTELRDVTSLKYWIIYQEQLLVLFLKDLCSPKDFTPHI